MYLINSASSRHAHVSSMNQFIIRLLLSVIFNSDDEFKINDNWIVIFNSEANSSINIYKTQKNN